MVLTFVALVNLTPPAERDQSKLRIGDGQGKKPRISCWTRLEFSLSGSEFFIEIGTIRTKQCLMKMCKALFPKLLSYGSESLIMLWMEYMNVRELYTVWNSVIRGQYAGGLFLLQVPPQQFWWYLK